MKKTTLVLLAALPIITFSQNAKINLPAEDYSVSFEKAYQQYPSIPRGVLEAVAYTNTHIQNITHNPGDAESCTGLPYYYGVMGLVADGKNVFRNNLVTVSQMSGISANDIMNDPEKNILAYAAAYAQEQNNFPADANLPNGKSTPETQIPIIISLSELPDPSTSSGGTLQNNFAINTNLYSVLNFLNTPENAKQYNFPQYSVDMGKVFGKENYKVLSSSSITMLDYKIVNANGNEYEFDNSIPQQPSNSKTFPSTMSTDYAPAIWNAAASCNYTSGRTVAITAVVIHDTEGSYAGSISWFQDCNSHVSAHYVLRSSDGQVTQMVLEKNKAWHVGSENPYTIGIEHEGYQAKTGWYTTAMYQSSANLVKDICNSGYGIKGTTCWNGPSCNGSCVISSTYRIKGHQHYPNQTHDDPGPNWNWYTYYNLINGSSPPPPSGPANDNCSSATTLTPNTTCVSTAGDLANATAGGLSKASCDVSSSSTLQDVWYKFTATASTSTITLTPSSGLDGVLSLYTSCASGQIGCSDNGGGKGGVEKISASGLTSGSTYYVRVYSYGSSAPTTTTFNICVTASVPVACGTPAGLSASSVTASSATLNWGSVSGATSYNVQYRPTSSSTWIITTSTTNSKAVSGLSASTSYEFQAQTVCSSGTSAYSSSGTFTTSAATSTTATVQVGNSTGVYSAHPYGTVYMDERTEYIITKSELTAGGWTSATPNITSLAFQVSSAAAQSMNGFTISLAHTTSSSFASTTFLSGTNSTTVYSGTAAAASGWNNYTFSTPFAYNGTDNLLIKICWDNSSYTANSSVFATSYANFVALYYRADVSSGGVCAQSTGTQSYYRPNTKMIFSSGNAPPPPPTVNCTKTYKTTIEGFDVYQHTSGAIMYKAKMAIDADGSPRAYGPNNSGLDYTANAGSPGNWWGIVTDASGNPIIQGSSDPYPGMYVSTTSLVDNAYGSTKTQHYVNSEVIPFFVLPSAVTSLGGIKLGDMGYVYNTANGKGCYAIFADGGPSGKLGEGSMYLAAQLGINNSPKTGGASGGIDYIVFPNSGYGQGTIPTLAQINSMASAKLNSVGGTGITSCIPAIEPPAEDSKREANLVSASVEDELTIYPNPFEGTILHGKFSAADDNNMTAKIYDMTGREIFSQQISRVLGTGGEFSLSFDTKLENGMYVLIGVVNDKQYVQRIIVR